MIPYLISVIICILVAVVIVPHLQVYEDNWEKYNLPRWHALLIAVVGFIPVINLICTTFAIILLTASTACDGEVRVVIPEKLVNFLNKPLLNEE